MTIRVTFTPDGPQITRDGRDLTETLGGHVSALSVAYSGPGDMPVVKLEIATERIEVYGTPDDTEVRIKMPPATADALEAAGWTPPPPIVERAGDGPPPLTDAPFEAWADETELEIADVD